MTHSTRLTQSTHEIAWWHGPQEGSRLANENRACRHTSATLLMKERMRVKRNNEARRVYARLVCSEPPYSCTLTKAGTDAPGMSMTRRLAFEGWLMRAPLLPSRTGIVQLCPTAAHAPASTQRPLPESWTPPGAMAHPQHYTSACAPMSSGRCAQVHVLACRPHVCMEWLSTGSHTWAHTVAAAAVAAAAAAAALPVQKGCKWW